MNAAYRQSVPHGRSLQTDRTSASVLHPEESALSACQPLAMQSERNVTPMSGFFIPQRIDSGVCAIVTQSRLRTERTSSFSNVQVGSGIFRKPRPTDCCKALSRITDADFQPLQTLRSNAHVNGI